MYHNDFGGRIGVRLDTSNRWAVDNGMRGSETIAGV